MWSLEKIIGFILLSSSMKINREYEKSINGFKIIHLAKTPTGWVIKETQTFLGFSQESSWVLSSIHVKLRKTQRYPISILIFQFWQLFVSPSQLSIIVYLFMKKKILDKFDYWNLARILWGENLFWKRNENSENKTQVVYLLLKEKYLGQIPYLKFSQNNLEKKFFLLPYSPQDGNSIRIWSYFYFPRGKKSLDKIFFW